MYNFINDYNCLGHPTILKKMEELALEKSVGYGLDLHCDRARSLIKKEIANDNVDIHFLTGGTATNLIAISAFLRPHHAVIGTENAHIHEHEAGSIEATGHKVLTVETEDGKLRPLDVIRVLQDHKHDNQVKAKMVYISNSTEVGTIYSKEELKNLYDCCKENDLILFIDGARIASAIMAEDSDLSLKDIAELSDAFYIGGTKNGALLGEALVIVKEELKEDFRYIMKQKGGIMAKSFLMGIQFECLFEEGLYYELASHANEMAKRLARGLEDLGISFIQKPQSNQLFPIFDKKQIIELRKNFAFEDWARESDKLYSVRFVTTWVTEEKEVDALIKACSRVLNGEPGFCSSVYI